MANQRVLLIALSIAPLPACSSESVKRGSFEIMQNLHDQQVEKGLTGKCPPRQGYDDYQRQRKSAQSSEE